MRVRRQRTLFLGTFVGVRDVALRAHRDRLKIPPFRYAVKRCMPFACPYVETRALVQPLPRPVGLPARLRSRAICWSGIRRANYGREWMVLGEQSCEKSWPSSTTTAAISPASPITCSTVSLRPKSSMRCCASPIPISKRFLQVRQSRYWSDLKLGSMTACPIPRSGLAFWDGTLTLGVALPFAKPLQRDTEVCSASPPSRVALDRG